MKCRGCETNTSWPLTGHRLFDISEISRWVEFLQQIIQLRQVTAQCSRVPRCLVHRQIYRLLLHGAIQRLCSLWRGLRRMIRWWRRLDRLRLIQRLNIEIPHTFFQQAIWAEFLLCYFNRQFSTAATTIQVDYTFHSNGSICANIQAPNFISRSQSETLPTISGYIRGNPFPGPQKVIIWVHRPNNDKTLMGTEVHRPVQLMVPSSHTAAFC